MPKNYTFEALGLMDSRMDQSLLNIIELAARVLDAPSSFASILEHHKSRQFFPACFGLPDELEEKRETPIDESICRFVQADQKTVAICDLLLDERTKDNPLVHRHGLRSYIGTPIHTVSGKVIGALCCMSNRPNQWTSVDRDSLERLALCIDDIIRARAISLEERKTNDRLNKLTSARSGFIAHMSHEIRTPLTGILGSIRLLNSMNLEGKPGDLIGLLNRSSVRLLDFVNDTLDLAKLDAGRFKIIEEECDLAALATDVMATYKDVADSKSISLKLDDGLSGTSYLLDKMAIGSIVHNLLGNAVKFTEEGFVAMDLAEDGYGQVVISITDTGIGIPEAYQATIFDEFEQAGPTIARTHGGTGLGMAIVKRLVEIMDGEINLESRPGAGTKISVTLPLEAVSSRSDAMCRNKATAVR